VVRYRFVHEGNMAEDSLPPVTPKNERHASLISQEIAASLRRIESLAQSLHPVSPAITRAQFAEQRRKNRTIAIVIAVVLVTAAVGAAVWWFAR
jgi:hypothetical protein